MPNLCWGHSYGRKVRKFRWDLQLGRWNFMPSLVHTTQQADRSSCVTSPFYRILRWWLTKTTSAEDLGCCRHVLCENPDSSHGLGQVCKVCVVRLVGGFISYTPSIWILWLPCFSVLLYLCLVCTSSNNKSDGLFTEAATRWGGKVRGLQSIGEVVLLYKMKSPGPQPRHTESHDCPPKSTFYKVWWFEYIMVP